MRNMLNDCRAHYEASAELLDNVPEESKANASARQLRQIYEAARFAHFMNQVLSTIPQVRPL
jgi:hypothetical protein